MKPISNRDNIPILSYILLGGRCRHCGEKISIRYPVIEGLTAAISGLLYLRFDIGFAWVVYLLFCAALIALAFIDADHRILPDVITLNGLWIGIGLSIILPLNAPVVARMLNFVGLTDPPARLVSLVASLIGAAVGGGLALGVGSHFRAARF